MKQPVNNPTASSCERRRNEVRCRGHVAKMRRKPLSVRLMSLMALCLPSDRLKTHFDLNVIARPRKLLRTYVQSFYRIDHIYEVLQFARQSLDDRFSVLEFGTANGYAFTKMLYATKSGHERSRRVPRLRHLLRHDLLITWTIACYFIVPLPAGAHRPHVCPEGFPDQPAISGHLRQADIVAGTFTFDEIVQAGGERFNARFNTCDGQGRHATTGGGDKRASEGQHAFIRTSAPDANSCSGCHNLPRSGGAGEFVANVFVLAQVEDPAVVHVLPDNIIFNELGEVEVVEAPDGLIGSNERNTLGMFGAGAIEMVAREMTTDLHAQVEALEDGTHVLTTKGVEFEVILKRGEVVAAKGIDTDLIVKPFHQAGVVASLREFTNNAFNHHHGMQPEERFDVYPDKGTDYDEDGVSHELTIGDITATTLFQAALGVPGRLLPSDPDRQTRVDQGEMLFDRIHCTSCHIPEMQLHSRYFVEPNPFNPPGNFSDMSQSFAFDMTQQGQGPFLDPTPEGGAVVRAYTDLKRHNLCDDPSEPDPIRFFCNERRAQGRPEQDGRPGTEFFMTRKLWDVGNSDPYGHRGDLTTITEAILMHGGEARGARDAFVELSDQSQADVVLFLKTLQVLPESSARVVPAP